MTALIPVVGGVILLLCQPGVRKEHKVIAHIAVLVTALLVLGLIRPLMGAIHDGDALRTLRVGAMVVTGVIAMISFIKSFRDARRAR